MTAQEHLAAIQSALDAFEESGLGYFVGDVILASDMHNAAEPVGGLSDKDQMALAVTLKAQVTEFIDLTLPLAIYGAKYAVAVQAIRDKQKGSQ